MLRTRNLSSNGRFQSLLVVLAILFSSVACALFSLGFCQSTTAFRDAAIDCYGEEAIGNTYSGSYIYPSNQSARNDVLDYFSKSYIQNFFEYQPYQMMPVVLDYKNNAPSEFLLSIGATSYGNLKVSSTVYNTQQKATLRFETMCINLYKYLEPATELSYDRNSADGIIYLPDVIADQIIDNEKLSSYDDLIDPAKPVVVTIGGSGVLKKYRIANIFHIKGFNNNYCVDRYQQYNDYDIGSYLFEYIGAFCFVQNLSAFVSTTDSFGIGIFAIVSSKKETARNFYLNVASSLGKASAVESLCTKVYIREEGQTHFLKTTSERIENSFLKTSGDGENSMIAFAFTGAVFVLAFLALIFFLNREHLNLFAQLSISLCPSLIYLVISHFIRVFSAGYSWYLFFSAPANLTVTLVVCLATILVLTLNWKERTKYGRLF